MNFGKIGKIEQTQNAAPRSQASSKLNAGSRQGTIHTDSLRRRETVYVATVHAVLETHLSGALFIFPIFVENQENRESGQNLEFRHTRSTIAQTREPFFEILLEEYRDSIPTRPSRVGPAAPRWLHHGELIKLPGVAEGPIFPIFVENREIRPPG